MWLQVLLLASILLLTSSCATIPRPLQEQEGIALYYSLLVRTTDDKGENYAYGFYFNSSVTEGSAQALIGSCAHDADLLYVFAPNHGWTYVKPLVLLNTETEDLFIGYIPEARKAATYFTISDEPLPNPSETVITVAEEATKELALPQLQKLSFLESTENYLLFKSKLPLKPSFSGAPVATSGGRLIGVMCGYLKEDPTIYFVTPIGKFVKAYRWFIKD